MNKCVDELREVGRGWAPYVAPLHGGVEARVLSILRDPGPATQDEVGSGFICVENNDGSAELQAGLLEEAGISPFELLTWIAYPWCINRAPKASGLDAGVETILHLLELAPKVKVVLTHGPPWPSWILRRSIQLPQRKEAKERRVLSPQRRDVA